MTKLYVAVIADAIDSRGLAPPARKRLQTALQQALPRLNQRYRKALAARFDVTLGDELQCLLADARTIWEISHYIRYQFPEVDWVVACGRGPISTALIPGITAPKVDGPCFHAARAALEVAKRDRQVLTLSGFPAEHIPAFAAYYSGLYWSWTARQRALANKWRGWGGAETGLPQQVPEGLHPSRAPHLGPRQAFPTRARSGRLVR